jgi:hypothetical protein
MRKRVTMMVCLLALQVTVMAADDKPIRFEQLPAKSQQIIKKYYPDQSISLVKRERDLLDRSYEVIFTNGDKIEFDRNGEWKEIESRFSELPKDVVPKQIREYVEKHYPKVKINKIEKDSWNCLEIELANDMDLKFDSKYRLIDMDR